MPDAACDEGVVETGEGIPVPSLLLAQGIEERPVRGFELAPTHIRIAIVPRHPVSLRELTLTPTTVLIRSTFTKV